MEKNANNLELNKGDQFIIALDVSASMQATDTPSGKNRLEHSLETLSTFVNEATKWDPDGVSFYTFGHQVQAFPDQKLEDFNSKIKSIKPTEGATQTHLAIERAYAEHRTKKSDQTFCMVFTDGAPSDPDAVKQTIVKITNEIKDEHEFAITFLTVGNRTAELDAYLNGLDDNLKGAKYDIVDVKKIEEVDFVAAVAGALHD